MCKIKNYVILDRAPDNSKSQFFLEYQGNNRPLFFFDTIIINSVCKNVLENSNCCKLIIILSILKIIFAIIF